MSPPLWTNYKLQGAFDQRRTYFHLIGLTAEDAGSVWSALGVHAAYLPSCLYSAKGYMLREFSMADSTGQIGFSLYHPFQSRGLTPTFTIERT